MSHTTNAGNHHKINYIEFASTDIEQTKASSTGRFLAGAFKTTDPTTSPSAPLSPASTAASIAAIRMVHPRKRRR